MHNLSLKEFKERINRLSKKNAFFAGPEVFTYKIMQMVSSFIQGHIEKQMAKYGLLGDAWMVLMMVYNSEKEQIISTQVCESLGSNKSTMTRMVDSLIEKGFLEREYDASDRRKIFLKITKAGKKMLESNIESHGKFMREAWNGIDIKIVSQNLEQLLKNLEKLNEADKK